MTEAAAGVDVTPKIMPMAIHTAWATVVVYGHELVAKRDVEVLASCLTAPVWEEHDHGVRMVTFRDTGVPVNQYGKAILANCNPDNGSVIVNMIAVFEAAVKNARADGNKSIYACWHQLLIQNYFHEACHLTQLVDVTRKTPPPPITAPTFEQLVNGLAKELDEEKHAELFSLSELFALAKSADIEPAHHAEGPFLSGRLMDLLSGQNDDWSKKQRRMLQDRIFYKLDAEPGSPGLDVDNFKGFCRLLSDESGEQAEVEWGQNTILGVGEEQSVSQLIKEVSTIIPAEESPVGPTTASPNEAASKIPTAIAAMMEEGLPDEPDDVDMMDDGDMGMLGIGMGTDTNTSSSPQTPVQNITPAPTAQDTAIPKFCVNCGGTNFPAGAKGCHLCLTPFNQVPGMTPPDPTGQTGPVAKTLAETGLAPEQTGTLARQVYGKVYEHIFNNCGFSPGSGDLGFTKPEAVTMPIQLTDAEKMVVYAMDCLDVNGRWCPKTPSTEGLRGYITKNTKLPAYRLYLNDNGVMKERLLLSQNPAKRTPDGTQYSKPALQARGGTMIMYVMEANDATAKATGKKFFPKVVDGVWQD